ncbi:hypothetical protein [Candidatus Symbiopectobacterium sp.]|uniref:hypothetical protein n=1 Tax=Candidatus Symbiopectobacterium sp. TaxID=2816440 RepID=UPI0025C4F1A2|nr:hypothetical protein [Candidatus Symbiopectobacterium sp.]
MVICSDDYPKVLFIQQSPSNCRKATSPLVILGESRGISAQINAFLPQEIPTFAGMT